MCGGSGPNIFGAGWRETEGSVTRPSAEFGNVANDGALTCGIAGAGKSGDQPPATPYVLDHARELAYVLDLFATTEFKVEELKS